MKNKRRSFSPEFKLEAVRLARESKLSQRQLARQLGIHRNVLARWRREVTLNGEEAFSGQGVTSAEEELVHVRRELNLVRRERDILKKALKVLARERR